MPDGLTILTAVIFTYYLTAAFVPGIRHRWGASKSFSLTRTNRGVERNVQVRVQPRMGFLSCLGFSVFFAGLTTHSLFTGPIVMEILVTAFVVIGVGAVADWTFESYNLPTEVNSSPVKRWKG
jgi:hypothetical protein